MNVKWCRPDKRHLTAWSECILRFSLYESTCRAMHQAVNHLQPLCRSQNAEFCKISSVKRFGETKALLKDYLQLMAFPCSIKAELPLLLRSYVIRKAGALPNSESIVSRQVLCVWHFLIPVHPPNKWSGKSSERLAMNEDCTLGIQTVWMHFVAAALLEYSSCCCTGVVLQRCKRILDYWSMVLLFTCVSQRASIRSVT